MDTNEKIIQSLRKLNIYRFLESKKNPGEENNNKRRIAANDKAILGIRSYNKEIKSGRQAENDIRGIGKTIAGYIDGILNASDGKTGISEIDDLSLEDKEEVDAISELSTIHGIGFIKAYKLYHEYGIRNIEEFINSDIEKTEQQRISLQHYHESTKRIPRRKISKFKNRLREVVKQINEDLGSHFEVKIMGSYYRDLPDSKDIDVILTSPIDGEVLRYKTIFLDRLFEEKILVDQLSFKNESFQGICYIDDEFPASRIDIQFVNRPNEYPYALLYFAGNKNFNTNMRSIARQQGYDLSNRSMTNLSTGEKISAGDVHDIFNILGMEYVEPKNRNY